MVGAKRQRRSDGRGWREGMGGAPERGRFRGVRGRGRVREGSAGISEGGEEASFSQRGVMLWVGAAVE